MFGFQTCDTFHMIQLFLMYKVVTYFLPILDFQVQNRVTKCILTLTKSQLQGTYNNFESSDIILVKCYLE